MSLNRQYSMYTNGVSSVATVSLEAEIDECQQRLMSGEVLMMTHAANNEGRGNRSAREIAVTPFLEAFDNELYRLGDVVKNQQESIESSAEVLLKNVHGLSRTKSKLSQSVLETEIDTLKKGACSIQRKTIRLKTDMTNTEKKLLHIALDADRKLGTSCVDEADRTFDKAPWNDNVSSGHIVKLISDIFSLIRDIEDDDDKKDGKEWVAPASFERVTTKYWVKEDDLPEVLIKAASELPILVYGRSGLLTKNIKEPGADKDEFWKSMAAPISSVYFDSDNMDLYKERIKRSEGAQLFRVRWYGNKPKNDKVIYCELKTHHECWIANKSVKERVGIIQSRMLTLMDTSDGQWSNAFALELVEEASPPESSKEFMMSAAALLLEIRALFCKFNLRPCVRTSYSRAAFQSAKNNNLRLTIDRDITVIDETAVRNDGSWCIEDTDVVPIDAFVKVPYGVFEVKVSGGEDPLFIDELKADGAIVEVPKFSKFLTGASLHNAEKVNMLPWWAEDALFAPLFKMRRSTTARKSTMISRQSLPGLNAGTGFTRLSKIDEKDSNNITVSLEHLEEGRGDSTNTGGGNSGGKEGGLIASVGMRSRTNKKKQIPVASRTPARVEPKSFFANERTFINWITVGSLFLVVTTLLYQTAIQQGYYGGGRRLMAVANAYIACAIIVVCYGLGVYYRRLYLMINAKPYGYADGIAPCVLASMMIAVFSSLLWVYSLEFSYPNAMMTVETGICEPRELGLNQNVGFSAFELESSGVYLDESKNLLLIPSLDRIVAIPATSTTTNTTTAQTLYQFPKGSEDIEAITIGSDGTIYVASEGKISASGKDVSDIIALNWVNGGVGSGKDKLEVTNRWRIDTPFVEGMAFSPDDKTWFSAPRLIVAGSLPSDTKTVSSAHATSAKNILYLDSYEYPLPVNGTSPPRFRLNTKYFTIGLIADEKVAAMQFFNGNLYLLYDNAMIIRAFAPDGTMIKEWPLPVAVENFQTQWEGMHLEQIQDDLILHLALDSPPQVWSLKLEGDIAPGSTTAKWTLPNCAASF